jgi:hypothetical protein
MRILWALDHALQSRSKRMLATLGVTGPQRLVIGAVGRAPGISAGELAGLLHLHPSTLTGVLSRLVGRRLLERTGDPADSRRALFRLTPRGRGVNGVSSGTVEGAVRRVVRHMPPARVAAAVAVLGALGAALTVPPGPAARKQPVKRSPSRSAAARARLRKG